MRRPEAENAYLKKSAPWRRRSPELGEVPRSRCFQGKATLFPTCWQPPGSEIDLLPRPLAPAEADEAGAMGEGGGGASRTANGCGHRQVAMALRAEEDVAIADKTAPKIMHEMGISCGIRRESDYHRYNSFKGALSAGRSTTS